MNEIQFLLYDLPDNEGNVQVVVKGGTLWMTQKAMAKLYAVNVPDISKHLKNIYETGEQKVEATVSKMEIVQQEGKRKVKREQTLYMLKTIIAVGYRVNSQKATKFRAWATDILDEYVRKISKAEADAKAEAEYDIFNKTQKIVSDFDREIKKMLENKKED